MNAYEDFRRDLKKGLSISEALIKYNLTFKQVFKYFHRPPARIYPQPNSSRLDDNIYLSNGYFHIRRKQQFYGSYNSLKDAQKVRNKLIEYGWDKTNLNRILKEVKVEKNKRGGKRSETQ